jgi:hypothetical protein
LSSWLVRLSALGQVIRGFADRGWETELDGFVATSEFLHLPVGTLSQLANLGIDLALTFSPDRPAAGTDSG